MTIAVTIALLAVAVVLWRVIRKARRAPIRPIAPRRGGSSQANNDDGSTLLTGVVLGSVLFGQDSDAKPTAESDNKLDSAADSSGGIGDSSDGGFSSGGDF